MIPSGGCSPTSGRRRDRGGPCGRASVKIYDRIHPPPANKCHPGFVTMAYDTQLFFWDRCLNQRVRRVLGTEATTVRQLISTGMLRQDTWCPGSCWVAPWVSCALQRQHPLLIQRIDRGSREDLSRECLGASQGLRHKKMPVSKLSSECASCSSRTAVFVLLSDVHFFTQFTQLALGTLIPPRPNAAQT